MPSAEAELEAAYLWLRERNPEAAVAWYNGAVDAVLTLETFPERCPLAPEADALLPRPKAFSILAEGIRPRIAPTPVNQFAL